MANCSATPVNFYRIPHEVHISDIWNSFYFFLIIPVAYFGSTLTVLLMINIIRYKRPICDLLIFIIALNDFCLVFTPTVIAQVVDHWFGKEICYMHYFLNVFSEANVLILITLASCERFWIVCKPFHYHRLATVRLILRIVAAIFTFNLSLAASPMFVLPVTLVPITQLVEAISNQHNHTNQRNCSHY